MRLFYLISDHERGVCVQRHAYPHKYKLYHSLYTRRLSVANDLLTSFKEPSCTLSQLRHLTLPTKPAAQGRQARPEDITHYDRTER